MVNQFAFSNICKMQYVIATVSTLLHPYLHLQIDSLEIEYDGWLLWSLFTNNVHFMVHYYCFFDWFHIASWYVIPYSILSVFVNTFFEWSSLVDEDSCDAFMKLHTHETLVAYYMKAHLVVVCWMTNKFSSYDQSIVSKIH